MSIKSDEYKRVEIMEEAQASAYRYTADGWLNWPYVHGYLAGYQARTEEEICSD